MIDLKWRFENVSRKQAVKTTARYEFQYLFRSPDQFRSKSPQWDSALTTVAWLVFG